MLSDSPTNTGILAALAADTLPALDLDGLHELHRQVRAHIAAKTETEIVTRLAALLAQEPSRSAVRTVRFHTVGYPTGWFYNLDTIRLWDADGNRLTDDLDLAAPDADDLDALLLNLSDTTDAGPLTSSAYVEFNLATRTATHGIL